MLKELKHTLKQSNLIFNSGFMNLFSVITTTLLFL